MKHLLTFSLLGLLPLAANERQAQYYSIENIPTPKDVVLEAGSIATMPDGKVAVGSRRGEVWVASNTEGSDVSQVTWQRYARSLHEPLGMFYKDGSLYATDRPEITKITDVDGDGRGDRFESITQHWGLSGDYHEYNFGSELGPDGQIWVVHCLTGSKNAPADTPWRGWAFKYSLDGEATPIASGIRSPGGIGFNAAGDCFYTDNQGFWNGSSSLKWLKPGSFQGNPSANKFAKKIKWEKQPEIPLKKNQKTTVLAQVKKDDRFIPPAVILPHGHVGNSPTGVITDTSGGKFGPFANQVFVGEQSQSQVQRVFLEKVNGIYQGAVWHFLSDFRCGIVPIRLSEQASLFVGGTDRGWGSNSLPEVSYTFERVRWTGKTPFEMHEMRARPDGFVVSFTKPIDPASAQDLSGYETRAFTYALHGGYGSPEIDTITPKIDAVQVSADRKSIHLKVSKRKRGHVHFFKLGGLKSADGETLWHPDVYYTLNEIPKS